MGALFYSQTCYASGAMTPPTLRSIRLRPTLPQVLALATALLALLLYLATLAPSITWQNQGADSGELATAVAVGGVPHPPGFPTYILLGKAFQLLVPIEDIAYRLNVMSAVFGAITVGLTFLLTRTVLLIAQDAALPRSEIIRSGTAFLAATALATGPLLWSQATLAEVYTLNAALFALILFLALEWWRHRPTQGVSLRSGRRLLLAAFFLGLGLGNHPTLAVLLAIGVPTLLFTRLLRPHDWGWLGAALASGLLVYLYLPLAATGAPPVNWGQPSSLSGFAWTVSGAPYRRYFLSLPLSELPTRLVDWGDLLFQQYNLLGVLVGVLGTWHLWERARGLFLLSAGFIVLLGGYSVLYLSRDSFLYLIPAALVFALWMGVGAGWLLSLPGLGHLPSRLFSQARIQAILLAGLVALVPLLTLGLNIRGMNLSSDAEATQFADYVVQNVPPGSLVLTPSDQPKADQHLFALWYKVYAQDEGQEIVPVASPMLVYDWYWETLRANHPQAVPPLGTIQRDVPRLIQLISYNLPDRSVHLTYEDEIVKNVFQLEAQGELWQVQQKPEE